MALIPITGELDPVPTLNPISGPLDNESVPAPAPSGILRRAVADPALALLKGAVGVPEFAVGLADTITGGYAGKGAEAIGFEPKKAREIISGWQSPELQQAKQTVQEAKGFFPTVGAMLENPSTIVDSAIESAPSMLGGAGIARGAIKLAPTLAPFIAGAIGEGAVSAGQTAEQIRQESATGTLTPTQSALAITSGAITGAIGVASGKLANKLGIGDIDTMLAGGAGATANKSLLRRLAEGVFTEGILEELPQSAQEQVAQNLATDKPWNEGVAEAAASGMLVGGIMGMAANVRPHPAEAHGDHPSQPTPLETAAAALQTALDPTNDAGLSDALKLESQKSAEVTAKELAPKAVEQAITDDKETAATTDTQVANAPDIAQQTEPQTFDPLTSFTTPDEALGYQQQTGDAAHEVAKLDDGSYGFKETAATMADEGFVTRTNGKPFANRAQLLARLNANDLTATHDLVEIDGGWIGQKKATQDTIENIIQQGDTFNPEQRTHLALRADIDTMTPAEQKVAIQEARNQVLKNPLTGIPNRVAYGLDERLGYHAAVDADSLKWVNDNLGHGAGDVLLKTIADAIAVETDRGYHISGDEYIVEGKNKQEVNDIMARVNERLKNEEIKATLPDGTVARWKGLEATHGTGTTLKEADDNLKLRKAEREAAGLRAARGEKPAGISFESPAGNQNRGNTPHQEVTNAFTTDFTERLKKGDFDGAFSGRVVDLVEQYAANPEVQTALGMDETQVDSHLTKLAKELKAQQPQISYSTAPLEKFLAESKVKTPVYHGTSADFTEFDRAKIQPFKGLGGFWFTNMKNLANNHASSSSKLMSLYISLKNPATFEYISNLKPPEDVTKAERADWYAAQLKKDGYDGFQFGSEGDNIYVVLDPTQIKSATGNNGAYDTTNPDINYSVEPNPKISSDAMNVWSDVTDDVRLRIVSEYLNGSEHMPWKLVDSARLSKIWKAFAKDGVVRDEKGLDSILHQLIENAERLQFNNEISGHERYYPDMELESVFGEDFTEDDKEKLADWAIDLPDGGWRISDYGLPKIQKYLLAALDAKTAEDKLAYMDMALNVVHQRSDLSSWFIEGGSKTLSKISGQGMDYSTAEPSGVKTADITETLQLSKIPIDIHQSAADTPAHVREDFTRRGLNPEAYYDHSTGRVGIIADNVASVERVQELLRHEWFHAGVATDELQSLYEYADKNDNATLQDIATERGFDLGTDEGRLQTAGEYAAQLAETEPKNTHLQNIVGKIREWLRGLGLRVDFTRGDVAGIIHNAIQRTQLNETGYAENTAGGLRNTAQSTDNKSAVTTTEAGETAQIHPQEDPLYSVARSLTDPQSPEDQARGINTLFNGRDIKNTLNDALTGALRYIMPTDRTIGMAETQPQYQPIKALLNRYKLLRQEKAGHLQAQMNDAQVVVKRISKAFKSNADLTALSDLAFKATTMQLHANGADSGWTSESWQAAGMNEQFGTLAAAQAALTAQYNKFTPDQKVAHEAMLQQMQKVYLEGREAALAPFRVAMPEEFAQAEAYLQEREDAAAQSFTDQSPLIEPEASQEVKDLALTIKAINDQSPTLRGDYMPLMRFGEYIVRTTEMDENGEKGKRVRTEFFDSQSEAIAYTDLINNNPVSGQHAEIETNRGMGDRNAVNIPASMIDKLKSAAETRGISGDTLVQLIQDAEALRINMMPSTSTSGHKLNREGVEGYSTNVLKVFANYISSHSNANAGLLYGSKVEQSFRDMNNTIKAYRSEPTYDAKAAIDMDTLYKSLYENERSSQRNKINAFVKNAGKTSFLWYLSSPSIWAVQWSQPYMVTIPKMAGRFGYTTSLAAYTKAAKRYLSGDFSDEKIDNFNREHEYAGDRVYDLIKLSHEAGANTTQIDGDIKAIFDQYQSEKDRRLVILKVLSLQGRIDLSLSHSLTELAAGSNSGDKFYDRAAALSQQVMDKTAFFMQHSETGSRRAAAVSSFELALKASKSYLEANSYASDVINDTLFDFDSANRGKAWQGNAGHIFGQFQFFRLHMLGKMMQLFKDTTSSEYNQATTEADKAAALQKRGESRKELAYMIGTSMALAGAGGTPIAFALGNTVSTALWSALSFMAGDDDDDPVDMKREFETAVREAMGDTAGTAVLKGLPAVLGADISQRIGLGSMGDVVMGDPPAGAGPTAKANWYAGRLAGPAWGMVTDSMKGFDAVSSGDWAKAAQYGSPKVVKDFMRMINTSQEGIKAGSKTLLAAEDVSPYSYALMMMGINPTEVALASDESRYLKNISVTLSQRRNKLIKNLAAATLDHDEDAKDDAIAKINSWSAAQPLLKITAKEIATKVRKESKDRSGILSKQERLIQDKYGIKGDDLNK